MHIFAIAKPNAITRTRFLHFFCPDLYVRAMLKIRVGSVDVSVVPCHQSVGLWPFCVVCPSSFVASSPLSFSFPYSSLVLNTPFVPK